MMRDALVLAASLVLAAAPAQATPSTLKLGIFISWEGGWDVGDYVAPAVLLAVDAINRDADLLPATELQWVWHDGQCDANAATEAMMDMKLKYDVDAFVGPPCSVSALRTVPMGAYWDLPFISWAAASPSLSDKALYPNFARVNANYRGANIMFLAAAAHFGWDRLGVVYADNGLWGPTADDLVSKILDDPNLTLGFSKLFPDTTINNADQSFAWMSLLKESGTRVVVVLGYCLDMRNILLSANRLGMLEGYQYFFLDVTAGCHVVDGTGWPDGWGPEANDEAANAFHQTFNVAGLDYTSAETSAFEATMLDDFARRTFEPYRFPPAGTIEPVDNVTMNPHGLAYNIRSEDGYQSYAYGYAALLYDAIHLYALAADAVIRDGRNPTATPELVTAKLPEISFTGFSGFIQLDENLDRTPDIALQQVTRMSDNILALSGIATFTAATKVFAINDGAVVRFPGGGTTPPEDFVLRQCTSADYEFEAAPHCNADLDLEVHFMLLPGVNCQDIAPAASVRCKHLDEDSPAGVAAIALAAVAAALAFGVAMWVLYYRLEAIVRYAQPHFCLVFLMGCVLLNVSVILRVGEPSIVSCVVSPYLFHVAFTVCFSALAVKIYRVWRVFETKRLKRRKVKVTGILRIVGVFLLIDVIILTLMAFQSPLSPVDTTEATQGIGVEVEQAVCGDGGNLLFLLWAIKICLMIGTCLLTCQVRHVDGKFSEAKHILVAVYEVTILSVVAILVSSTSGSVPLRILVESFSIAVASAGSICAIFGPKVLVFHGCADEALIFGAASVKGPNLQGKMSGTATSSSLLVNVPPPRGRSGSGRSLSLTTSMGPGVSTRSTSFAGDSDATSSRRGTGVGFADWLPPDIEGGIAVRNAPPFKQSSDPDPSGMESSQEEPSSAPESPVESHEARPTEVETGVAATSVASDDSTDEA